MRRGSREPPGRGGPGQAPPGSPPPALRRGRAGGDHRGRPWAPNPSSPPKGHGRRSCSSPRPTGRPHRIGRGTWLMAPRAHGHGQTRCLRAQPPRHRLAQLPGGLAVATSPARVLLMSAGSPGGRPGQVAARRPARPRGAVHLSPSLRCRSALRDRAPATSEPPSALACARSSLRILTALPPV